MVENVKVAERALTNILSRESTIEKAFIMLKNKLSYELDFRFIHKKLKKSSEEKEFQEFEERIKSEYDMSYSKNRYINYFDYISSLFMVDAMETAFGETGVVLPSDLQVLDIGAGNWDYVNSLYNFLGNYQGERKVNLTGIDIEGDRYKRDVKKLVNGISAAYLPTDISDVKGNDNYDMIFMAHMLCSPGHFKQWGLDYRSASEIFEKSLDLLKKDGIFVGFAYGQAGEAEIFKDFPEDKKLYFENYYMDIGPISRLISAYQSFNGNFVFIGRK